MIAQQIPFPDPLDQAHISILDLTGDDALLAKRYAEAIRIYTLALSKDGLDTDAYYGRGCARNANGDLQGSLLDLNRVIELEPANSFAYIERSATKQRLNDPVGSTADRTMASLHWADWAGQIDDQGLVALERKDYARAITLFTYATNYWPSGWWAHLNRALAEERVGQFDSALADLRTAQYRPAIWALKASRRASEGDLAGALELYDLAFAESPKSAPLRYGRGKVQEEHAALDGALRDFDAAVGLDPNNATYLNARGGVKLSKLDFRGAIADFDRALQLHPGFEEALANKRKAEESKP